VLFIFLLLDELEGVEDTSLLELELELELDGDG